MRGMGGGGMRGGGRKDEGYSRGHIGVKGDSAEGPNVQTSILRVRRRWGF